MSDGQHTQTFHYMLSSTAVAVGGASIAWADLADRVIRDGAGVMAIISGLITLCSVVGRFGRYKRWWK